MTAIANLRLTAKLISIIAPFIAKNDIRYYLNGINVRPHQDGGAVICATNGHALGAIHDTDAICTAEVTLRLDPRMIQACAACVKKDRVIKVMNGRLVVVEGAEEAEIYIQAGDPVIVGLAFPRYEKVIPKASSVKPGMLGAYNQSVIALAYLAAKAAVKTKIVRDRYHGVRFFNVGDENGYGVIRLDASPNFIGVLMPKRADQLAQFVPEWVARMPEVDDLAGMAARTEEAKS